LLVLCFLLDSSIVEILEFPRFFAVSVASFMHVSVRLLPAHRGPRVQ
jgi:hypothetical protein